MLCTLYMAVASKADLPCSLTTTSSAAACFLFSWHLKTNISCSSHLVPIALDRLREYLKPIKQISKRVGTISAESSRPSCLLDNMHPETCFVKVENIAECGT
jgi:hypothetical protein